VIDAGKVLVLDVDGTLCPARGEDETYAELEPYPAMIEQVRRYRAEGY